MIRSPSLTVGTRPFGLSWRYSGSRLPPNGPPRSSRSNGRSNSAQHHSTFCTLHALARPHILSIACFLPHRGDGNGASVLPTTQPPLRRKTGYISAPPLPPQETHEPPRRRPCPARPARLGRRPGQPARQPDDEE